MTASHSLLSEARPYWGRFALGCLMLAAFQLCLNRIDWLAKQAIDAAGQGSPWAWHAALWMLGLAVVGFAARLASRWFVFYAGRDIEASLRQRLLAQMHRLDLRTHRTFGAGDWINRSNSDLVHVRMMFGFGVMNVTNTVLATASALQIMLQISGRLTLVCLAALPVLVVSARMLASRIFTKSRASQAALDKLTSLTQNSFSGMRLLRSLGLRTFEQWRFVAANAEYATTQKQLLALRAWMMAIVGTLTVVGILLFFGYGAFLLTKDPAHGGISKGGFVAFASALGRMTWPMMALGWLVAIVERGRASYARLRALFQTPSAIPEGTIIPNVPPQGFLRVNNLSFSIEQNIILSGINLLIPAGTSCAIVGKTGSGKSTLAWLLARLWPTPPGTVFLDDVDLTTLSSKYIRQAIGYAPQEAFLFSTTIAKNIGFSLENPDSEAAQQRIVQAAAQAGILDEIHSLPDGLDTIVGERGVQLSGGQRQRVTLARALLWDPPVLILDDPMSAVDTRTEAHILQHMASPAGARKTRVLITHRVVAAQTCDQIVVLDKGQVVEQGSHTQLLQQGGLYATMAREQALLDEVERWA